MPAQKLQNHIQILLDKVKKLESVNFKKIQTAIEFGMKAHAGQMRKSGECFYIHPVRIAIKATQYSVDTKTIIGSLLHDILEDTNTTYEHIEEYFGRTVADLVYALTKVRTDKKMSLKKIFKLGHRDFRVILIKLLDRLDNLSDLKNLSRQKQIQICDETNLIYADIAHGLGLIEIEEGLRDASFQIRYPRLYQNLSSRIERLKLERKPAIDKILKTIQKYIPSHIKHKIIKHFYNPHHYQFIKNPIIQVLDSIILLTKNVKDCYKILGNLHIELRCIPLGIRDYISNPKANGWRGLETKLMVHGEQITVMIVTEEFYEKNRNGVITLIKEGVYHTSEYQNFLDLYLEVSKDSVRIEDVFRLKTTKDIHIMTPKGKVIELRYGSSVLDYAFIVHSDLGYHCSGAIINDLRYPPYKILEDGMIVKVLTNKKVTPKKEWLNHIVMPKARKEILKSSYLFSKK